MPTAVAPSVRLLDDPGAPPVDRRSAGAWFVLALFGFLVGQLVALVAVDVAAAVAGKSGAQLTRIANLAAPPEWYVIAGLVGVWVGFLGGPWAASLARGSRHLLADMGVRFRMIDLVGIAIGIGGQLLVAALYAPFIDHLHDFDAPTTKLTGAAHGWGFFAIAVLTVVVAPFMEELFFRGLLLRALVRGLAPADVTRRTARGAAVTVAVLADGLFFGLAHGEWVQLAGLAAFGAVLALVSYRTGRLGMNMVAHATFNLVAVLALLGNGSVVPH